MAHKSCRQFAPKILFCLSLLLNFAPVPKLDWKTPTNLSLGQAGTLGKRASIFVRITNEGQRSKTLVEKNNKKIFRNLHRLITWCLKLLLCATKCGEKRRRRTAKNRSISVAHKSIMPNFVLRFLHIFGLARKFRGGSNRANYVFWQWFFFWGVPRVFLEWGRGGGGFW